MHFWRTHALQLSSRSIPCGGQSCLVITAGRRWVGNSDYKYLMLPLLIYLTHSTAHNVQAGLLLVTDILASHDDLMEQNSLFKHNRVHVLHAVVIVVLDRHGARSTARCNDGSLVRACQSRCGFRIGAGCNDRVLVTGKLWVVFLRKLAGQAAKIKRAQRRQFIAQAVRGHILAAGSDASACAGHLVVRTATLGLGLRIDMLGVLQNF